MRQPTTEDVPEDNQFAGQKQIASFKNILERGKSVANFGTTKLLRGYTLSRSLLLAWTFNTLPVLYPGPQ